MLRMRRLECQRGWISGPPPLVSRETEPALQSLLCRRQVDRCLPLRYISATARWRRVPWRGWGRGLWDRAQLCTSMGHVGNSLLIDLGEGGFLSERVEEAVRMRFKGGRL